MTQPIDEAGGETREPRLDSKASCLGGWEEVGESEAYPTGRAPHLAAAPTSLTSASETHRLDYLLLRS